MIKYIIASKLRLVIFLICILLFILPFFWLKPGEMDIGGDSNGLYFYDPISNLKAFAIYSVVPSGTGLVSHNQYFLPFLLFVAFLKSIFNSPTVLISIFNGLKLGGSFIFMFLIIREFFRKEKEGEMTLAKSTAAIIGALFYTFSPAVLDNMVYALVTHSQVFLNPMMFYFALRYLITRSLKYVWLGLLITFIFSTNFSLQAPPPLFAFYPLAIFFLLAYNFLVLQKPIPWKGIIVGILFFLGLHAFHLFPVASIVFDKGSDFNTRIFESTSKVNSGLEYFNAIRGLGKVSDHILLPLAGKKLSISLIIVPALIVLGFLSLKRKSKTLLLISIFFFTTLFLVSANITQIGVEFYRKLFLIPGFGMFRGFFGQWQWVYTFFYALLAGLSISYFFSRIKKKYIYLLSFLAIGFLIARSWIVFNGEIVNVFHRGSKDVKAIIRVDPNYEKILNYIKGISNDGKILHIPFTDYGYNIVSGANKGVYMGQSMVSFLVGKNDFAGYQDIDPFSEVFVKLLKEKNYSLIKQMMSLLQIRYVLYNSNEIIYDKFFPAFPYGHTGAPSSPSAALDFVKNVSVKKIYEAGSYSIFEVDKKQYLPHFYAVSGIYFYDTIPKYDAKYGRALSFFPEIPLDNNKDPRIAFVDRMTCNAILTKQICNQNNFHSDIKDMQIIYQKINPAKYRVSIKNATKPFLLVFQNIFSPHWKLYSTNTPIASKNISDSYFDGAITELLPIRQTVDRNPFETNGKKIIYDNTHIQVNEYANAWYIKPNNSLERFDYEFIIEMTKQKTVYYSFIVSAISLLAFLLYGVKLLMKQRL